MNEFLENYLNSYGGEDSYDDMFLAKLTAVTIGTGALAGKYVYEWEEMSFDPATGLTAALAGGRRGTYSTDGQSPALEINNKQISTFPVYAQLRFRCVGDAEAVFDFDAQLNVTNISNRLYQLGITGTPTAGTFTITITNPDATTTTTGTIAYNASFLNVLSNVTTALNAVLGANYAECGGTSWATFYVRMGDSLHTLTAVNIGSLTGASGSGVSLMSAGSTQWSLSPEPLKFDNRTGIKVLNNGTLEAFPASYFQNGVVTNNYLSLPQTMGGGYKYFPWVNTFGRTVNAGDIAEGGRDDAYDGKITVYSRSSDYGFYAYNAITDIWYMNACAYTIYEGESYSSQVTVEVQDDDIVGDPGTAVSMIFNVRDSSTNSMAMAKIRSVVDATYTGSVVEVNVGASGKNSRFRVVRNSSGDTNWPTGAGTYDGVDGTFYDGTTGNTCTFVGGIITSIASGTPGASGTFTTADTPAKTVTVTNGIITSIV